MKRIAFILLIITGLLILTGAAARCQITGSSSFTGGFPKERIFLFTDRSLYAVNENICLKIDYFIDKNFRNKPWSSAVYVELINEDGHSLAQSKFQLSDMEAEGMLPIPEDIPSGIYYLKSYTKWMRNFPADLYEYKPIKIVNPFTFKLESTGIRQNPTYSQNFRTLGHDTVFTCLADKKRYKKREKVTVSVSLKKGIEFQGEASISICKRGANDFTEGYAGSNLPLTLPDHKVEFLPEPRGISISGKVISKETKQAIPYSNIYLALLNKNSFFSGFVSDINGRFIFTFPYYEGASDFCIEAVKGNLPLSFQIDNEYCSKPFSPGIIPFELTNNEREIAKEICINMQLNRMNLRKIKSETDFENQNNESTHSFYGEPTRVIYTSKYIELPDLREFIFELVPEFLIENQKKATVLKLVKMTTLAAYPPLCLVDNVPVTDIVKFLNIRIEKIEKIELVDKAYIIGKTQHNGIIQVFSKKGDMAGIDLPENSMFFNFSLYSDIKSNDFPDYSDKTNHVRIPDRRNTLYWNPAFEMKQGLERKFSFYTADMEGEYEVLIQGVSNSGEKSILGKTSFIVDQ